MGLNIIYIEPHIGWHHKKQIAYDFIMLYGYKDGKKIVVNFGFSGLDAEIDNGLHINYAEVED